MASELQWSSIRNELRSFSMPYWWQPDEFDVKKMLINRDVTPVLILAIFSAVLGMFQFGYNTGVVNVPQEILEGFIEDVYKTRTGESITLSLRDIIWSVIVSIFAIGGMLGGLIAPVVSNRLGRRSGLMYNNSLAILGAVLLTSSKTFRSIECLIVGRFVVGVNCGLNTALVPMYLTEIATVGLRGALGTINQLAVTVGLLVSQVLGLKTILGTEDSWPILFGFILGPAVIQLLMLPCCPESPRYLLLNCDRNNEARSALYRLRNNHNIENDLAEMDAENIAQQEEVRKYGKVSSVFELLRHPWLKKPLMVGVVMQLSQQLSGINAIFNYSTRIFSTAGLTGNYASLSTIGVGIIMVTMTVVSIPLMDRLGRRTLHLYGLAGMLIASIFLTVSLLVLYMYDWMKYISVLSVMVYTLFFAIGPGSIPHMITSELFTQGSRPAAMSISVMTNWSANFIVGVSFPTMLRLLGDYIFVPFTLLLALFWLFTYKKLPETKNRTFEEIAALFRPIQTSVARNLYGGDESVRTEETSH